MMWRIILKNLVFYKQKVTIAIALVSFLLFIGVASFLFTVQIKHLADAPLRALQTEIILQQDAVNKDARSIKTQGVIEPFNLKSFSKQKVAKKLSRIMQIRETSSALVLWQFDLQNNKTIVGLDVNEPLVGLRKIQKWLTHGSAFFSNNTADEVILERHFAKLFGFSLGRKYRIGNKEYTIVGVVDFKEQSNLSNAQIFMPYGTALALVGSDTPVINQVYVSLSRASDLPYVQREIHKTLPSFSVITKDRLLKNLSSFNILLYKFGDYFSFAIGALVIMLSVWILKMNRTEFAEQTEILRMVGWRKRELRQWMYTEVSFIILCALLLCAVFVSVFYIGVLPHIGIDELTQNDFKL